MIYKGCKIRDTNAAKMHQSTFSICFDAFHLKSDMMLMKIFFSRRHSPTNVTLRFVNIQNHSCLYSKSRTDLSEAFGDVFMCSRYYLELFLLLQLILTHLSQDHQVSVNKYLHFHPYLLLSSESIALTADLSSDVHQ